MKKLMMAMMVAVVIVMVILVLIVPAVAMSAWELRIQAPTGAELAPGPNGRLTRQFVHILILAMCVIKIIVIRQ